MKNILILGKGYIGEGIANFLNKKNFKIYHISQKDVDYFDYKTLSLYMSNKKIDIIINCSGYTGKPNVEFCEYNKEICWKYNVNLPVLLAGLTEKYNIPLIQIGSGCIYDSQNKVFSEEDEPNFGLFNCESSFYSKTKHAAEIALHGAKVYIFRIRMPFSCYSNQKNLINKLLLYDNLISYKNSLTSIEDFNEFISKFLLNQEILPYGKYNLVNEGFVSAEEIVEICIKNNLINKKWKFLEEKDLNFKCKRSNCLLSIKKIKELNFDMPNVTESLLKSIKNFR